MDDLLFSILTSWIDGGELQTSNLQWVLTAVPVLKSLVLGLSFIFWYVSWSVQSLKVLLHRAFFFFFLLLGFNEVVLWAWLQECAIWIPSLVRWEMMRLLSFATDNISHYFDRKGQGVRRRRVSSMQASWVLRYNITWWKVFRSTPSWVIRSQYMMFFLVSILHCFFWVQVFVPEFEHMFILGSLWSICFTDLLRDCVLCRLFVDSPWLLYHAWAALCEWTTQHCWPCLALVFDAHRLQSSRPSICCNFPSTLPILAHEGYQDGLGYL